MSTYATTGTTAAPTATTGTGRGLFGRNRGGGTTGTTGNHRESGTGALARNEAGKPGTKFAEYRAKSSERWGMARAAVREKFSKFGADISYGTYAVTHPIHPIRRRAAKDAKVQKKKLAEDRRRQEEGLVRSNAAAKVAQARESRISTLNQGLH